jgi:hypothetical protein
MRKINTYRIVFVNPEGKRPFRRSKLGRKFLKSRLKEGCESADHSSGSGCGTISGSHEHGNLHSGTIKGAEFLGHLNDY